MRYNTNKKLKILITGAAGQVAQALKEESDFFENSECIFFTKLELDITSASNIRKVIKKYVPHFIINTAAYTAVDEAEQNNERALELNYRAVELLVEECKFHNIGLIQLSTDYVFDGKKIKPYLEDDTTHPQSIYGRSKLEGENAIIMAKLPLYAIIRTSWIYSDYGTNFVKTMLRIANNQKEISVVDDQYGSPTYANDLARALLTICTKLTEKTAGVYHYANEGSISWFEFAKTIFEFANIAVNIRPVSSVSFPTKANRPPNSVLDSSKISKIFNLEIINWKKSLKEMLTR